MDHKHTPRQANSTSSSEKQPTNGRSVPREPLYEDSTLNALMKQARELEEIEHAIGALSDSCSRIRRSLTTLVPALEVHMHGLQSEARRWKHEAYQAEEKHNQAIIDIEKQMNTLGEHLDSTEQRLQTQHQEELNRLRQEANSLRKALMKVKGSAQRNEHLFDDHSSDDNNNYFEL